MKQNANFGEVIACLKAGGMASRPGIEGFIFRQIPSVVPADVVPKMTSLPKTVKDQVASAHVGCLSYSAQWARIGHLNGVTAYCPTIGDLEAENWNLFEAEEKQQEPATARETVGTATPTE